MSKNENKSAKSPCGNASKYENVKKAIGFSRFSNQNNNFTRASRFFVHFFAVTARLRLKNAQFHVVQRTYTSDDEISSLYLNLDMVLRNSTLGGSTYILQS